MSPIQYLKDKVEVLEHEYNYNEVEKIEIECFQNNLTKQINYFKEAINILQEFNNEQ